MRPAALIRGATRKATSSLSTRRPESPLASSSACRPTAFGPAVKAVQPDPRDDPVLATQRHGVGERADGGELGEGGQPPGAPGPPAERLHQLEGDARPREVLVGVRAVGAPAG